MIGTDFREKKNMFVKYTTYKITNITQLIKIKNTINSQRQLHNLLDYIVNYYCKNNEYKHL